VFPPLTRLPAAPRALQAISALAALQHPSSIHPSNLVPALQTALLSLHQRPGSRGWERALLASPMVLGLLSWATQLLEQPATAAALGPEAPLLVLEALSHLGCPPAPAAQNAAAASGLAGASRAAQHCRRLWRRAHAALGDAADAAGQWTLHLPDLMSPDMIVRYYEACARAVPLATSPSKSPGLGLLLRSHLRNRCAARITRTVPGRAAQGCRRTRVCGYPCPPQAS
jgi:hypothetical protein